MKKWLLLFSTCFLAVAFCSCGKEQKPESDMVMQETEEASQIQQETEKEQESLQKEQETNEEETEKGTEEQSMMKPKGCKLTYIGHAAVKIETEEGKVIYIDPAYENGDYSTPADLILITHDHSDHDVTSYCTLNENARIIKYDEALVDGQYNTFTIDDIIVEAVPAGHKNHDINKCVGYLITVDGITVYHAGDTSTLDSMSQLSDKGIDYALYPIDGIYNMDATEATEVATTVGARVNIPIHEFDSGKKKKSDAFLPEGRMVLEYGDTIELCEE